MDRPDRTGARVTPEFAESHPTWYHHSSAMRLASLLTAGLTPGQTRQEIYDEGTSTGSRLNNHAMSRKAVYLSPADITGMAYTAGARHTAGTAQVKADATSRTDEYLSRYCFPSQVLARFSSTRTCRRP